MNSASRSPTSASTTSTPTPRASPSVTRTPTTSCTATSSPAATASTASPATPPCGMSCGPTHATIRSPGSASSSQVVVHPATSSSLPAATAASRSTASARPSSAACTSRCEDAEQIEAWSDDRIWEEMQTRFATDDGFELQRGPDHREGHPADAQRGVRADAVRPALPGRRRGAHRPADRRQGAQPGRRGRARARPGADPVARPRRLQPSGRLHRDLPAPGLAGPALLVVDDRDAAPAPGTGTRSSPSSSTPSSST